MVFVADDTVIDRTTRSPTKATADRTKSAAASANSGACRRTTLRPASGGRPWGLIASPALIARVTRAITPSVTAASPAAPRTA